MYEWVFLKEKKNDFIIRFEIEERCIGYGMKELDQKQKGELLLGKSISEEQEKKRL